MLNLFEVASQCLAASDPEEKCKLTNAGSSAWLAGELDYTSDDAPLPIGEAG